MALSRNIECIQDFRGDRQAAALELLVEKFEKDVGEWRHLSSSDLDSLVDEELERAQMREAHFTALEAAKAVSSDLKFLETRKIEIGNAIDTSNSALFDAKDKIEKAKEMIKKANLLLSKSKPVCFEEILGWSSLKSKMMKSYNRR